MSLINLLDIQITSELAGFLCKLVSSSTPITFFIGYCNSFQDQIYSSMLVITSRAMVNVVLYADAICSSILLCVLSRRSLYFWILNVSTVQNDVMYSTAEYISTHNWKGSCQFPSGALQSCVNQLFVQGDAQIPSGEDYDHAVKFKIDMVPLQCP